MPLLSLTPEQATHVILVCWWCYFIVWTLAAIGMKRTVEQWSPGNRLGYLISWILVFYLLGVSFRWHHTPSIAADPTPPIAADPLVALIACVLCVAGLVVCFWARYALGRNWSGNVTLKAGHELVENGPYRFIRHPIYTGLLLMILATALLRGTPAAFLAVVVFFAAHVWKLRQEEALMRRNFPNSYPEYCTRTKALIPGIF
jgi:protein-S-isoprenylcysteine O-methyltransferase Ste14